MTQEKTPEAKATSKVKAKDTLFGAIIESPIFWVAFMVLAFGIPLYRSLSIKPPKELPVLGKLPDFQLVNQDAKEVSLKDFLGSVLVVNFVFTSCPDVCPLLTKQMKKIQDRVISTDKLIQLVSISVDPVTDTPERLKAYAEKYDARTKQWSFLTGPFDDVKKVIIDGFKMPLTSEALDEPEHEEHIHDHEVSGEEVSKLMQITHGEHFILVDQVGQIRAYTRASNDTEINALVKNLAILMNSRPPGLSTDKPPEVTK